MSQEALTVVQVRDGGDLVQFSGDAVGEKWSDSKHILKMEPVRLLMD